MASNWEIGLLERLQSRGLLDFTEEDQSDFYAESTTDEEKINEGLKMIEEKRPQDYMAGALRMSRRGTGQLVPEAGFGGYLPPSNLTTEYYNPIPQRMEPLTVVDVIQEAVKPRWEIPGLSSYSRAMGRATDIMDAPIKKRHEELKSQGILADFNMRHGTVKYTEVPEGEGGLSGYPYAKSLAYFMPLIGDPETGEYSLLDVAFGGLEAGAAVKYGKGLLPGAKSAEFDRLMEIMKKMSPPEREKTFQKEISHIMSLKGEERMLAAKKWQHKWATDPETFVRNQGARIELEEYPSKQFPRKKTIRNKPRVADIDVKVPNEDVWREYEINRMIEEGIIPKKYGIEEMYGKEYAEAMETVPGAVRTGSDIQEIKELSDEIAKRLSTESYNTIYEGDFSYISDEMKKGIQDYLIEGPKSAEEIDKFVKLARRPDMTMEKMADEGFELEYKAYLDYKEGIDKEFARLEFQADLPHEFVYPGGGQRIPDAPTSIIVDADETVKYGFFPEEKAGGAYYHGEEIGPIQASSRKMEPGKYREMITINPEFAHTFESTAVHELQHFTTKGQDLIPNEVRRGIQHLIDGDFDSMVEYWYKNNLDVPAFFTKEGVTLRATDASPKEVRSAVDYYIRETEVQARLQQVRFHLDLKPGQKVTDDHISMLIEGWTEPKSGFTFSRRGFTEDLLNVFGHNRDKLKKALNTLPALVPLTEEDQLSNNWEMEENPF